jgi:ectoine hydroxylase-related dioxygenase (phytanoyl-CoA dioxygenase family)
MDKIQLRQLKARFDRDGFVIVRDFVPTEQLTVICRRAESVMDSAPRSGMFSNVTKGLEKRDDYFADWLNNGPHLPLLTTLMGSKPEPTTASFFTKNNPTEQVQPHSDAMDGGVIWIAIDRTDKENGCMQFLKGSHLRQEEFADLKAHQANDLTGHPDAVEAAMDPGDIAFFRPTTVHWSGPSHNGLARRGFNCFYVGLPDKWFTKIGKGKGSKLRDSAE